MHHGLCIEILVKYLIVMANKILLEKKLVKLVLYEQRTVA